MEPVHLGTFELVEPIRKGGMGEVWRGVHLGQNVPVAIKVMTAKRARHPKYLQAFRNEVHAVAALDHPCIVLIFDHGKVPLEAEAVSKGRLVAGSPYLVMELASMGSLDQLQVQLQWGDLKGLLIALLDSLAHAHARGVIHRDLKPANVLICGESDPRPGLKLTDFGLASLWDDEEEGTSEKTAGTPRYMAPEVFEGRWRDYGPWTDLYAMGCMVYELITHRPLFNGTSFTELRKQHLYEPPPVLRRRKNLPEQFERWLLRLLEKRPGERYSCAAEAAWALMSLPEPDHVRTAGSRHPIAAMENQGTSLLPSAISNSSGLSSLFLPQGGELSGTSVLPQHGLASAETYLIPEGRIEEARTFLKPSVAKLANDSTFLFMNDFDWRAVTPKSASAPRDDEEQILSSSPLEIEAAPMPITWQRHRQASSHTQLLGVGLSLFELRKTRLAGRTTHRNIVWEALKEVHFSSRAQLVLLEGASGLGKSRVVEWVCQRASELGAATIMRAGHSPISGPTDGLARMVSRSLHCVGLSRADTRRRVRQSLKSLGATNDYEWDALTEIINTASTKDDRAAKAKVVRFSSPAERYAVILRFLARSCSNKPVILWLDDVQWGSDVLWFAQHLLKQQSSRPCPLLLLMTVNTDHLEDRAMESHILSKLMELEGTERVRVEPLGQEDHSGLIENLLDLEESLASMVQDTTKGNPLFAIQLVGSWVKQGLLEPSESGFKLKPGVEAHPPGDILDIWKDRVKALIEDESGHQHRAEEALEIAACLGMDVDAIEWREACREAGLDLTTGFLLALVQSNMVKPSEGCIGFIHGMARQAVEESARAANRWDRHNLTCARMLSNRYAADHPGIAERLGLHLLETMDISKALSPLLEGATERCRSGEYRHAIDLLDRREWAMLTLSSSNARIAWGEGWLLRAFIYRVVGRFEEGNTLARTALEQARLHGWESLVEDLTLEAAHLCVLTGRLDAAQTAYDTAAELCKKSKNMRGAASALHGQGQLLRRRGDLHHASLATRQAMRVHEHISDTVGVARCLHSLWMIVRLRGDLSLARDLLLKAAELYEKTGHQVGLTRCLQDQGLLAVVRGNFAMGSDLLQRAMSFFESLGIHTGVAACLGGLAAVAQGRGETEAAERWWRRAIALREEGGDCDSHEDKCSLALALLNTEKHEEATVILSEVGAHCRENRRFALLGRVHIGLTLSAAIAGEWEAWDENIGPARKLLDETGLVDPYLATTAYRAAEAARAKGQVKRALESYALALSQWRTLKQRKKISELEAIIEAASAKTTSS